ncbi:MAG: leucine-rich repeat protein [Oscillospiraceae bacterium]|nr:leucine-rich repeat protein [Oscillospiraceae bacterium]
MGNQADITKRRNIGEMKMSFDIRMKILRKYYEEPGITEIHIPEEVEKIGKSAFAECSSLQSVHIPDSVQSIGDNAFRNCKELCEIIFDGEPETIGLLAFYGCWNMSRIESKNTAASYVKDFMKRMKTGIMTMEEGRALYKLSIRKGTVSVNGFSNVISGDITYTYKFPDHMKNEHYIVFPAKIGEFKVSHIACRSIPDNAIVYCGGDYYDRLNRSPRALTAAAWLCGDKMIHEDAVEKIQAFIKNYSDDVAKYLQECDDVPAFKRFIQIAQPKASLLEKMIDAVQGKPEITAMLLDAKNNNSEGIKTIFSLDDAPKMTVKELSKLWSYHPVVFESGETYIEITKYRGHEKHVVIPKFIGKRRVYRISGVFPECVESVEVQSDDIDIKCSFRNCTAMADKDGFIAIDVGRHRILTDYIGPKNIKCLRIPDGITRNCYNALGQLPAQKVILPDGFEILCGSTFSYWSDLQEVILPESLKEIGLLAFSYCSSLKHIYIPRSVEKIIVAFFNEGNPIGVTIHAPAGSYAEQYAKENYIPFEAE